MFRLRLWMMPKCEYFLAREDDDHFKYLALCRDEFEVAGERRTSGRRLGTGEVMGNFIRIRFHLLPDDFFLCLVPNESKPEEFDAA